MYELTNYSDCVNQCPTCPLTGKGLEAIMAVNVLCDQLDDLPTAPTDPAEMQEMILDAGAKPRDIPAVQQAAKKITDEECSTSGRYKGI